MKNDFIRHIIHNGTIAEKLELYGFDSLTPKKTIRKKFKVFARANFPEYFKAPSPEFHDDFIDDMIFSYYGENRGIAGFRGSAKTSLKKLFDCFVLLNDRDSFRKFIKVLSRDLKNAKSIVVDVYNMMVKLRPIYGNPFEKEGDIKREETMGGFSMRGGRKYTAGTVGQIQRGHAFEESRPDWIWFEDVEDSDSISSMAITEGVIARCEEAINGLSFDMNGSYFLTCNYISDQGTVQYFINKSSFSFRNVPLLKDHKDNNSTVWPEVFPPEKVAQLKKDAEDFYGEFMGDPQRSQNKFFDLDRINEDLKNCTDPVKVSAGVSYWSEYKPHHRYGQGSDHSEGIGQDSNTLVGFDFTTGEQIYSYANNLIAPDLSAHEFARVGREFGNCIWAPEKNNYCGGTVVETIKNIPYRNVYRYIIPGKIKEQQTEKLGWETNSKTKYNMFSEFRKDYNDGLVKINDKNILAEMKAYTNNDLNETQAGLITRHFDLLMATAIAWQMRKYAVQKESNYEQAYNNYINA
jgi:hypothetical protein